MEAGIDPIQFWNMTPAEITAQIEGYSKRVKWQATLTYILSTLNLKGLHIELNGGQFPGINNVFPGLFDDVPELQPKPSWEIMKERVLAHNEDYKRNRGDKA